MNSPEWNIKEVIASALAPEVALPSAEDYDAAERILKRFFRYNLTVIDADEASDISYWQNKAGKAEVRVKELEEELASFSDDAKQDEVFKKEEPLEFGAPTFDYSVGEGPKEDFINDIATFVEAIARRLRQ